MNVKFTFDFSWLTCTMGRFSIMGYSGLLIFFLNELSNKIEKSTNLGREVHIGSPV